MDFSPKNDTWGHNDTGLSPPTRPKKCRYTEKKHSVRWIFTDAFSKKRIFPVRKAIFLRDENQKNLTDNFYIIKWQFSLSNSFAQFEDIISIFEIRLVLGFLGKFILQHCDFYNWCMHNDSQVAGVFTHNCWVTERIKTMKPTICDWIGCDWWKHVKLETKQIDNFQQITFFLKFLWLTHLILLLINVNFASRNLTHKNTQPHMSKDQRRGPLIQCAPECALAISCLASLAMCPRPIEPISCLPESGATAKDKELLSNWSLA